MPKASDPESLAIGIHGKNVHREEHPQVEMHLESIQHDHIQQEEETNEEIRGIN